MHGYFLFKYMARGLSSVRSWKRIEYLKVSGPEHTIHTMVYLKSFIFTRLLHNRVPHIHNGMKISLG